MLRNFIKRRLISNFSSYKNYGPRMNYQLSQQEVQNAENKQYQMLAYYRKYGHLVAQLDPLKLIEKTQEFPTSLDFGLKYQDQLNDNTKYSESLLHDQSLKDVTQFEDYLKKMYTQTVCVEFDHLESEQERNWLYQEYERVMQVKLTNAERLNINQFLIQGEAIDHYMHKKFTTFKRYSGEGAEASVVGLRALYAQASELGVTNIVQGYYQFPFYYFIAMAHRGRFPIMLSILDYPPADLFRKIMGRSDMPEEYTAGIDDVVHHLSTSNAKLFPGAGCKEKQITISVVHNPSTLEVTNPVSQGKTKAKQDDTTNPLSVLNVQLHGDAAFAGQGIIYESLQLQNLTNYSVKGTIHITQNNQIGYTTNTQDSRSTRYSTDVVKGFGVPVIHVNGEDVESVHKVFKFAVQYRQKFQKDIMIDLFLYRKYGHNEVDEPEFTQPTMYKQIRKNQKPYPLVYCEKLVSENLVKPDAYNKIRAKVFSHLDEEYEKAKTQRQTLAKVTDPKTRGSKAFTGKWEKMQFSQHSSSTTETGLDKQYLKDLALQSVVLPPNFNVHPRIKKFFIDDRVEQVKKNEFDWPTGEAMAVASLLDQGYNVRLSGQDVQRGTFSQRHFVFVDQKSEEKWTPLESINSGKNLGRLQVANSCLSEASVMAFDFGYGFESPQNLVIWEAQFGDFFNTGQYVIDTFITNSEEKWMRQNSLVMLLPHGFDGAGPEHSSCRIERWLQMGIQQPVNFQFVLPTTPSNVYHMLRRQMLRKYRKPLIVASAKTLLRFKGASSKFEDIDKGTQFQPIYLFSPDPTNAKVVFFCSGKIQYDLREWLKSKKDYAIVLIEELLPFPKELIQQQLQRINKQAKMVWVQEEPENAGAYHYAARFIEPLINKSLTYVGRPAIAAVAVGATDVHVAEGKSIQDNVVKLL